MLSKHELLKSLIGKDVKISSHQSGFLEITHYDTRRHAHFPRDIIVEVGDELFLVDKVPPKAQETSKRLYYSLDKVLHVEAM